jgi:TM2 domain-containing membrane protein YozV
MNKPTTDRDRELIDIDLRDPVVAAVLAWLWPGAGHMYQGRYQKGTLFMVCILGAFFFGLILGDGKVVYASWSAKNPDARRWQYILQLGVGLPAMPAIVQQQQVSRGKDPFFVTGYRDLSDPSLSLYQGERLPGQDHLYPEAPMAPPLILDPNDQDVLAKWHQDLGINFDMGTLYTVLAGLLNVLAIYDAYAGPLQAVPQDEEEPDKDNKEKTA